MKVLESAKGIIGWVINTAMLIVVGLLVARALVEYFPVLGTIPLFGKLVRAWDPTLQAAFEKVGMKWSHEMRGVMLPAFAIVLVMLRTAVADFMYRLSAPKPPPRPPAPAPLPKTEELPRAAAPASRAVPPPVVVPTDPAATVVTPPRQVSATGAPIQSATGTGFFGVEQQQAGRQIPALIGRYQVLEELGHGAMGTVYKANDPKIGRTVAIKTISTVGAGPEMDQYRQRFLMEAKSAGRLNHPSIVAVYDVADDSYGKPCLVLEFVEGEPLDHIVEKAPLPLDTTLDYLSQVARALAYAHGHGIIHRDIKPANIMVTKNGQAKLSDFGIAKIEGTTLTVAGQVLGTPAFMSPEQCQGLPVDSRSDVFSLGAVLYTLCSGTKPFPGETFTSVAYQVVHTEQLPLSQINPALPPQLDTIVARCMAKDPKSRYASAGEMADDLDALRAAQRAAAATPVATSA